MKPDKNTESTWITEKLDELAPQDTPPVGMARAQLETRLIQKENRMTQNMWHKIFTKPYRPAWAGLVVVGVLAIALTFPGVRAAAVSFLGLFRVEQVEAVQIGISLENLPDELEDNFIALDNLLADQLIIDDVEDPLQVAGLAEAGELAGFVPRIPTRLADKEQQYIVQSEASIRLLIDQPQWQALIDSMGYDLEIPQSVDGAEVKFLVPDTVLAGFGSCQVNEANELSVEGPEDEPVDCTILLQSKAPEVEAPPGLDINQAGAAMLQVLGMSPEEAAEFSSRVDWTSTLVVPVPLGANYHNVTVDGVEGVLLEDIYNNRIDARYTLLWVKDGMFYALTGIGNRYAAVNIANSLE